MALSIKPQLKKIWFKNSNNLKEWLFLYHLYDTLWPYSTWHWFSYTSIQCCTFAMWKDPWFLYNFSLSDTQCQPLSPGTDSVVMLLGPPLWWKTVCFLSSSLTLTKHLQTIFQPSWAPGRWGVLKWRTWLMKLGYEFVFQLFNSHMLFIWPYMYCDSHLFVLAIKQNFMKTNIHTPPLYVWGAW